MLECVGVSSLLHCQDDWQTDLLGTAKTPSIPCSRCTEQRWKSKRASSAIASVHCTLATQFCVTNHPLQWPRGPSLLLHLAWLDAAFSTSKRNVVTNVRLLLENHFE